MKEGTRDGLEIEKKKNGQGMKFRHTLQPWNMKMNLEDIMLSDIN